MNEPENPRVPSTPGAGVPPSPSKPPPFVARFADVPPETRVFSVPWMIGTGALVVALVAAFIAFRGLGPITGESVVVDAPPAADEPGTAPKVQAPKAVLLPPRPLDITSQSIDARGRSDAWNATSRLGSIHLSIDGGKPEGAVEFVFGLPRGPNVPAAPLKPERLTLSYSGGQPSSAESKTTVLGYALVEPNCPLEAAYHQATQAGLDPDARVDATYLHSTKHGRGVWSFTPSGGPARNVDGDNCAILVR